MQPLSFDSKALCLKHQSRPLPTKKKCARRSSIALLGCRSIVCVSMCNVCVCECVLIVGQSLGDDPVRTLGSAREAPGSGSTRRSRKRRSDFLEGTPHRHGAQVIFRSIVWTACVIRDWGVPLVKPAWRPSRLTLFHHFFRMASESDQCTPFPSIDGKKEQKEGGAFWADTD
jgi:hypothetical protein